MTAAQTKPVRLVEIERRWCRHDESVVGSDIAWLMGELRTATDEIARLTALSTLTPQRKPVCETCGDSVIYVPKSGFGNTGEWRHLAPPRIGVADHPPVPKVFVS